MSTEIQILILVESFPLITLNNLPLTLTKRYISKNRTLKETKHFSHLKRPMIQ